MRYSLVLLLSIIIGLTACSSCHHSTSSVQRPDSTAVRGWSSYAVPIQADATCDYPGDEASLLASGWTKTFEDNFSTEGDLTRWNVWSGGAYNNELQYYSPSNVQVRGGVLTISAKKETITGPVLPNSTEQKTFSFTSGRLESKIHISADATTPRVRMAARIKLPKGYGMWPAFWSYGEPWPAEGEIDALEARGQEPARYQTNYFYGPDSNLVRKASGYILADEDLTQCYHVYELVWSQTELTSYLDGKLVERKTSGGYIPSLFGTHQRVTLNLAVGGNFFDRLDSTLIEPGAMQVDWVRVYTAR